MFSDNDLLYYENIPLQKRFTKPLYHDNANQIIKSIVRGNLKFNYCRNMNNPHSSNNYLKACNSMGNVLILLHFKVHLLIMNILI